VKIHVIAILSIFTYLNSASQCFEKNFAFADGELLNYQVYYNWGFIWMNAGYVEFKVKTTEYQNRKAFLLDAYGSSHKSYDWLFKVRDHYQTYLDIKTLQPLWFDRQNYEGGFEVKNEYYYDHPKKLIYAFTATSDRPFKKDTLKITNCTFDLVSLVYYCRNLDFSGLHINDSIPVNVAIDNGVFNLFIRYLGKEDLVTRSGITYRCIKFSAMLVEGTIFKGGENLYVWITDDNNRVPVLVDAKILIGSVKAYLNTADGLLNPSEAGIKKSLSRLAEP
jgi:hypothetical protein